MDGRRLRKGKGIPGYAYEIERAVRSGWIQRDTSMTLAIDSADFGN